MTDPIVDELAAVYARMSGWLLSEETVQTALELITSLSMDIMPGATGAGVTLIDAAGQKTTAAATSDLVALADGLQYELNEGPCLTAWATKEVVRVDDLETETLWPRWREAVLQLGIRSVVSAPITPDHQVLGATKVYSDTVAAFNERSASLLTRLGEQAGILLANVQSLDRAERLSDDLREALQTRNVIAWANGILMERHHVGQERALLRLMQGARRNQRELVDEANDVIGSALSGSE